MPKSVVPTYLIVTGASVARRTPEVLRSLAGPSLKLCVVQERAKLFTLHIE